MKNFIVIPPNPMTQAPYTIEVLDQTLVYEQLKTHHKGELSEVVNLGWCVIFVDEEGAMKQHAEPNVFASLLYHALGSPTPIFGTVILTDLTYSPDPTQGVEGEWAEQFIEKYQDPSELFAWLEEERVARHA